MRALLSERDATARRALTQDLQKRGYEVVEVQGERQLLAAMKKRVPDLLFLDVTPGPSGESVFLRLREQFRSLPVIVISEAKHVRVAAKALALGAAEYLVKPIDVRDLHVRLNLLEATIDEQGRLLQPNQSASSKEVRTTLTVALPELHDSETGRLDAQRIAQYLGIPLKQLAGALGASYTAVHKTPAAESLQAALRPIKRSLEILDQVIGKQATIRAWLRSPHPDLGNREPLEIILEGHAGAVHTVLENALSGIPS